MGKIAKLPVISLYGLSVEAYANERNIGKYSHVVSQIRDAIGEFTTKQMDKYFKVNEKFCDKTVECIKEHPEWDDDQVIEAVELEEFL